MTQFSSLQDISFPIDNDWPKFYTSTYHIRSAKQSNTDILPLIGFCHSPVNFRAHSQAYLRSPLHTPTPILTHPCTLPRLSLLTPATLPFTRAHSRTCRCTKIYARMTKGPIIYCHGLWIFGHFVLLCRYFCLHSNPENADRNTEIKVRNANFFKFFKWTHQNSSNESSGRDAMTVSYTWKWSKVSKRANQGSQPGPMKILTAVADIPVNLSPTDLSSLLDFPKDFRI